jgi:hypothetical protein
MKNTIHNYLINSLIVFLFSAVAVSQSLNIKNSKGHQDNKIMALDTVNLIFINPGVDPFGGYRWQDVAGNVYSDTYRNNYGYNDSGVQVQVTFEENDVTLNGQLVAENLKPNFAYQLKINGISGTASNERIGLAGRWWQEEWDGSDWTGGQNLNNKGDGTSPSPNDAVYFDRYDDPDPTSLTGLKYRYTGYMVFDYFITDENGDAVVNIDANSSYHVLWNTIQQPRTTNDGPPKSATFDPDPAQSAYDADYIESTMTIYGEWERLPMGEVYLASGVYDCQIIMTEESFHGWLDDLYTGQWAAAMGATLQFTIEADDPLSVQLSSFRAESDNSCVLLKWVTESEINHAGFEILRSSHQNDGYSSISNYQNNLQLMGQGNTSIKQDYLYIDRDVLPGQTYWYYLVDMGLDGHRTNHGPVYVDLWKENGLNHLSTDIPDALLLYPNFPNPFNSMTVIRFDIPDNDQSRNTVSLAIYNNTGQKVRTLFQSEISAGSFEIEWDGRSDEGKAVSSGIYYAVLGNRELQVGRKMVFIK